MHTITFFAPKGGTGRTSATMALAAGFLALGKRVMVMDATDQAAPKPRVPLPTTLRRWHDAMSASRVDTPQLHLVEAWTPAQVADQLSMATAFGFDVMLIDTASTPDAPQLEALSRSDLVLAPATGPFEARQVTKGIEKDCPDMPNLMGLVTGCRDGVEEEAATRSAFGTTPVLRTSLSWSRPIADLTLSPDLASLATALTCEENDNGFARYCEVQTAWAEVLKLTVEVQWALDGLRLEDHRPDTDYAGVDWQASA